MFGSSESKCEVKFVKSNPRAFVSVDLLKDDVFGIRHTADIACFVGAQPERNVFVDRRVPGEGAVGTFARAGAW